MNKIEKAKRSLKAAEKMVKELEALIPKLEEITPEDQRHLWQGSYMDSCMDNDSMLNDEEMEIFKKNGGKFPEHVLLAREKLSEIDDLWYERLWLEEEET